MQALIEESEQRVRTLQEHVFLLQLTLGPAQAPAHMKAHNIFDSQVPPDSNTEVAFGSPGAITLVDPGLNSLPQSPKPEPLLEVPFINSSRAPVSYNHKDADDMFMSDSIPGEMHQGRDQTVTAVRKRKRFSESVVSKKARTGDKAQSNKLGDECTPHTHESISSRTRRQESRFDRTVIGGQVQDDDGNGPTPTSRPTSWPRTRLFRRSAGLSVKKLTDVFERLKMQHDKHLPAIK